MALFGVVAWMYAVGVFFPASPYDAGSASRQEDLFADGMLPAFVAGYVLALVSVVLSKFTRTALRNLLPAGAAPMSVFQILDCGGRKASPPCEGG